MLTKDINDIINSLLMKKVVSIPTDTVHGLSCIIDKDSVAKAIKLKDRDSSKGFIIISSNVKHLLKYVDTDQLTAQHLKMLSNKSNEPTTWIVPAISSIKWLTGGRDSVAIRIVKTDTMQKINSKIDDAIVSTSANISGQEFHNDVMHIEKLFPSIYILDSIKVQNAKPSRIIELITGKQIR